MEFARPDAVYVHGSRITQPVEDLISRQQVLADFAALQIREMEYLAVVTNKRAVWPLTASVLWRPAGKKISVRNVDASGWNGRAVGGIWVSRKNHSLKHVIAVERAPVAVIEDVESIEAQFDLYVFIFWYIDRLVQGSIEPHERIPSPGVPFEATIRLRELNKLPSDRIPRPGTPG